MTSKQMKVGVNILSFGNIPMGLIKFIKTTFVVSTVSKNGTH